MELRNFLSFFGILLTMIIVAGCIDSASQPATPSDYTGKYKVGNIATNPGGKDGMAICGNNFAGMYSVKQVYLDCSGKGWHTNGPVQLESLSYSNVESRYPICWNGGMMDITHIPNYDVTCKQGESTSVSSGNFGSCSSSSVSSSYGSFDSGGSRLSGSQTSIEKSKSILSYINSLRQGEGKSPLLFDTRIYNLAMARANDMVQYRYLDHVNPITGTCPDNMKYNFGFSSSEYLAENAYGDSRAYWDGIEKQAVDRWMTSTGHHFNLMYDHSAGAVACSNGYCVFLGLNNDHFGEGCHTAAEGIAYWSSRN